jgi:hypothetical protein
MAKSVSVMDNLRLNNDDEGGFERRTTQNNNGGGAHENRARWDVNSEHEQFGLNFPVMPLINQSVLRHHFHETVLSVLHLI